MWGREAEWIAKRGMAQKKQQKEAKRSMEGKGGTGGIDLSWGLHREVSEGGGRQGGGEGIGGEGGSP